MTWVNVGVAAVETGASLYGANKAKQTAGDAAKLAGPHGASGDFGTSTVDNQGNMHFSLNPQDQMFGDMARKLGMGALGSYKQDPLDALTADQRSAGGALDSFLQHQGGQAGSEADSFFAALQKMGSDPQAAANDRYNLLTKQAAPGEEQARNALQQKLFAQGRLGTSGGGVDTKALYDSQGNADLGRQAMGQDYGMQWQKQLADMFGQFSGMAGNSGAQRYQLANSMIQGGQANDQFAMSSAGNMQQMYQQLFQPLFAATKLAQPNPDGAKMVNAAGQSQNDAIMGAVGTAAKFFHT